MHFDLHCSRVNPLPTRLSLPFMSHDVQRYSIVQTNGDNVILITFWKEFYQNIEQMPLSIGITHLGIVVGCSFRFCSLHQDTVRHFALELIWFECLFWHLLHMSYHKILPSMNPIHKVFLQIQKINYPKIRVTCSYNPWNLDDLLWINREGVTYDKIVDNFLGNEFSYCLRNFRGSRHNASKLLRRTPMNQYNLQGKFVD